MNKWQVICPLVVIAFALGVVAVIQGRNDRRYFIQVATASIGADLIRGTNSALLVPRANDNEILPHMERRLFELHRAPTHIAAVLDGDEPRPIGDGTACSRLVLTNEEAEGILIRLAQSDAIGSFHVLGYLQIPQKR